MGYRSAFLGKMHFGGTAHDTMGHPIREERDISKMDLGRDIVAALAAQERANGR